MKTLGEYIEIYKEIANRVGVRGESVNLLSQLLANATYLNVSENISFLQESSFSRATLMNSKIQHCMDNMYSVFRGNNPRVYVNYESNSYAEFRPHDLISSSSNFKVYFEGYLKEDGSLERSDLVVPPGNKVVLVGIISRGISTKEWTLSSRNTYYVDFLDDDLSSDLYVLVGDEDELYPVTRSFSDHVEGDLIFDLTLPNFGSRLYLPQEFRLTTGYRSPKENMRIKINALQYCKLDEFKENELSRLSLTSGIINPFTEDHLLKFDYDNKGTHNFGGVIFFKESERDSITTIHYRASRDRFINSSLRSNSDIGRVLEEDFTDKIHPGATSFEFKTIETTRVKQSKKEVRFSLLGYDKSTLPVVANSKETVLEQVPFFDTKVMRGLTSFGGRSISEPFTFNQRSYRTRIQFGSGKILENQTLSYVQEALKVPLSSDDTKLESGELRLVLRSPVRYKDPEKSGKIAEYELVPSNSVIKLNKEGRFDGGTNKVKFTVILKGVLGENKVISTFSQLKNEGLAIKYRLHNGENDSYEELNSTQEHSPIEVDIKSILESQSNPNIDRIYFSLVADPSNSNLNIREDESISILKVGTNYSMKFQEDTIYVSSSIDGAKLPDLQVKNKVTLYKGNEPLTEDDMEKVEIQVLSSGDINSTVEEGGSIVISNLPNNNDPQSFIVIAKINGESVSSEFTIRTTGSIFGGMTSVIHVSGNTVDSFHTMTVRPEAQEFTIPIENQSHVYVYSSTSGFEVLDVIWSKTSEDTTDYLTLGKKFVPTLNIYYAPKNTLNLITDEEIAKFKRRRLSYYVTNDIKIDRGKVVKAKFIIDVKLYRNESISDIVKYIVDSYSYKFNFDIMSKLEEIKALVSKIENVKVINSISLEFSDELNNTLTWGEVESKLKHTYFTTSFLLNTSV